MFSDMKINMMRNIGVNQFSFGMRLKFIREFRGLTQRELGIQCGFSMSTAGTRIGQYESNEKYPRADIISKLKEVLNVEGNMLCDLDGAEGVSSAHDSMLLMLWMGIYGLISPGKVSDVGRSAIEVDDPALRSYVKAWSEVYLKFQNNEIGKHDYIEWMLQWPK